MTTLGSALETRARYDSLTALRLTYTAAQRNAEHRAYAEHFAGYLIGLATLPDETVYDISARQALTIREDLKNPQRWGARP